MFVLIVKVILPHLCSHLFVFYPLPLQPSFYEDLVDLRVLIYILGNNNTETGGSMCFQNELETSWVGVVLGNHACKLHLPATELPVKVLAVETNAQWQLNMLDTIFV